MVPTINPVISAVPGKPNLLTGAYDLATVGYRADEYFVAGTASSYNPPTTAEYTTRIVVLQPIDEAAWNGTVIVEWLNVSGGIDAPAVWFMAHREIVRAGYAYVVVSAQRVGVEGGLSLVGDASLKTLDPQRYSSLHHPGDSFAYDIFTQVGRAVRAGVIDGLTPQFVLAAGESQSATFLTTYVNDVDPGAGVYDGFLIHSRFGSAAPLDGTSLLDESGEFHTRPVPFRADLRVPVLAVITETDLLGARLLGYVHARVPDTDTLRVWEIPGSAHGDNYTIKVGFIDTGAVPLDQIVAAYAPTNELMGQQLPHCINFAPQHHYVLQAAVAGLHDWVRTGRPAPSAPPIDLTDADPPEIVVDANGLATGGLRTPWVDVPTARTSGASAGDNVLLAIFGSGEPFDAETLARLYPGGRTEYLARFAAALDQAIGAGFVLAADRQEILDLAAASFSVGDQIAN
ncbi:alpha/beta hydrolase domain-containing protein [Mycolicibacterium vinylchloridicum]|uniref:alpha/beta hydrolase domain-containing protein n=1 Tax=Mycolicibacterium vinylchloridicum TaxID=2736928 RepID=UPI0015CC819B|nr:alpha/beta hydrolase domain-containing protein [Mycolicibacterium vinylchloridicum]